MTCAHRNYFDKEFIVLQNELKGVINNMVDIKATRTYFKLIGLVKSLGYESLNY